MTDAMTRSPAPLRDVLYELSLAKDVPDAELLDELVRRYPEHAEALTAHAIEIVIDSLRPDEDAKAPKATKAISPMVSRAMSKFQNALCTTAPGTKLVVEQSPRKPAANPFSALDRDTYRALAGRLNVNSVFLGKIRDCQLEPETIPVGFQVRVALELAVPLAVLTDHLAGQPQMIVRPQFFKAEQKPEAGQRQSFQEAVGNSGLTSEQQAYLLNL